MWTYKGLFVFPADRNSAGIRWETFISLAEDSRFNIDAPPRLRADTKQGMRELINHYLKR